MERWRCPAVYRSSRQQNPVFSKPAEPATLKKNFRSAAAIVTFNNRLFDIAAAQLEDASHQELYKTTSLQHCRLGSNADEGLVRVRFHQKSKEDGVEAALNGLLDDLSFSREKGYSLADMAVLVSTNSEAKK